MPENYIQRVIQFAQQGYTDLEFPVYDTDWDSEAYLTVAGQNSNNSIRVTDGFLKAVEEDGDWDLMGRITNKPPKHLKPAICGTVWVMPRGPVPIPASSTIPLLTTGTLAQRPATFARRTLVQNICSWTIPPVTWPH